MKQTHEIDGQRRKARRFGACGEEWVAVLFLLVAVVGVLAERVLYLDTAVTIV